MLIELRLVRNHLLDFPLPRLIDGSCFAELAFSLTTFFGQNVAFTSLFAFDLTGSGNLKTLFGTTIRFHFWHIRNTYVKLLGIERR